MCIIILGVATQSPLTSHGVPGHQGRAEGTEAVERFSQQPLLPVAPHLPVAGADVVGHGEAGHVGESVFLLCERGRGRSQRRRSTSAPAGRDDDDDDATLTLMCFPPRPMTKASSTSQSTSFN